MTTNHLAKDVTSVAGSREYVPGDRLTAIDWKVTARVNKLMTKEFENQLGQSFLIMLDHTISGKTAMDEIEKAISLSASIIVQASHQQIPIGLMTIADDTKNFPIKIGQDHQLRLIEHLAKLQLPTSFNFDEALLKEINKIEKNTILFIVQTEINARTQESIRMLVNKGIKVVYCFVCNAMSEQQRKQLALMKQSNAHVFLFHGENFKADISGGEQHASTV